MKLEERLLRWLLREAQNIDTSPDDMSSSDNESEINISDENCSLLLAALGDNPWFKYLKEILVKTKGDFSTLDLRTAATVASAICNIIRLLIKLSEILNE